jgi:hypothetical protein
MKIVIIPVDGAVYVDGYSYSNLDLSFCPNEVHAIQWNVSKGWIEFKENDEGIKPQNQIITELPSWAVQSKAKWDEAKALEEAAKLAAEEAARLAAEEAAE